MALEIQKGRSKWWYGRIVVDGKTVVKNLGVPIEGTPPKTLREFGDTAFERSRVKAQTALEKLQDELKKRSKAEELVQAVHQIRTGHRINSLPLTDMFRKWKQVPRKRPVSDRYIKNAESYFVRFRKYIQKHFKNVKLASDVQSHMVLEFLRAEEAKGLSPKTYNNILIFLRSCFDSLKKEAGLVENPFEGIPTQVEDTVYRKPFTSEELSAIIEAAKSDPFIEPIIITGICTAMRRGDCCQLLWNSVDMKNRFINVKTSKTGEFVQIPIFPLLEEILLKQPKDDSEYVFPKQASMYRSNPDGITWRVKKILESVGFVDDEDKSASDNSKESTELAVIRGSRYQERKRGVRKASIRDFHSFRVTWVTLALTAGVPIELVQKVTGHRTAQIVQKHYFQPGAEDFRKALASKLPALVVGKAEDNHDNEVIQKLKEMNSDNWEILRNEILDKISTR